jgi:hypothetical protein
MGISGKDSQSNNYKLRETVQDELGKTFVYDLVEDDIDETSASEQAHIGAKLGNALSFLIVAFFPVVVTIIAGLNTYIELLAPQTKMIGKLDKKEDGTKVWVHSRGRVQTSGGIPILITGEKFNGSVSLEDREQSYRFQLANPSNISLSLDGVSSEVEMSLYSDKDGTGVIGNNYGYTSAYKSKSGVIKRELGVGNYILVVRFKARDTKYSLQIVNDTSQVQNLGYLDQKSIPKNGSVSLKNPEQFYGFQLANPSNISLFLDDVNSEVHMSLFSDKDGTGVIGANYGYTSAFNSKPGIIKRELGVGNYIVVVRLKARETDYNLTMSAP